MVRLLERLGVRSEKRRILMRRGALVALGMTAVVLVGCSSGETKISKSKSEKFVADQLNPKADKVTCPDGVTAKASVTYQCQVHYADGDHGTVTVHVQDDKGNVVVNPDDLHIVK
jgi:hypothetical protein